MKFKSTDSCWQISSDEMDAVYNSAVKDLQELIRIPTVNPPGNETDAAKYIAERFSSNGFEPEIIESEPNRGNIIARVKGKGSKPALILLSHLDTVPADEPDWIVPPFSGEIVDDKIYGRGAIDCKYIGSLWLNLMLKIKERGIPLNRDIIFLATSDEEDGIKSGIKYMIDNHFDKIQAGFCLNEGGGFGFKMENRIFYLYQTAEKGLLWLTLKARGTGGHAAMPPQNYPIKSLVKAINRWSEYKFPIRFHPATKELLTSIATSLNIPFAGNILNYIMDLFNSIDINSKLLDRLPISDTGEEFDQFKAMLKTTLTPTSLKSGSSFNVVPDTAQAGWDMRFMPDEDINKVENDLQELLPPGVSMERSNFFAPSESPVDSELVHSIKRAIIALDSEVIPVPFIIPGYTDGHFLRKKNVHTYGFAPVHPDDSDFGIHTVNENIPLRSIKYGVNLAWNVIKDFCGNDI